MIRAVRFNYVNILKRNPKGVNRFDYMDRYIEMHNHPTVKTYVDFQQELLIDRRGFKRIREEKEQREEEIELAKGAGMASLYNMSPDETMLNDNDLSIDITKKTFLGWMKEGFDKKQRTDAHKFAYSIFFGGSLFVFVNLYMLTQLEMLPRTQHDKVHLNPESEYTYPMAQCIHQVGEARQKLQRLTREYQELLDAKLIERK